MSKRTPTTTDRAVADSNVVNFGLDFKLDLSAMAASSARFHSISRYKYLIKSRGEKKSIVTRSRVFCFYRKIDLADQSSSAFSGIWMTASSIL